MRAPPQMPSGPRRPAASRPAALLEPASPLLARDRPPRRRGLARTPPYDHARLRPAVLRRLDRGQHRRGLGRLGNSLDGRCRVGRGRCRTRHRRPRLAWLRGGPAAHVPLRPRHLGLRWNRRAKCGRQRPSVVQRRLHGHRRGLLSWRGIRLGAPLCRRAGPVLLDQRRQRAVRLDEAAARRDKRFSADAEDATLHAQAADLILRRRGEDAAAGAGGGELVGRQIQEAFPVDVGRHTPEPGGRGPSCWVVPGRFRRPGPKKRAARPCDRSSDRGG